MEELHVLRRRLDLSLLDERAEDGLAILRQLDHAGEHISELIGLACLRTALALDLHDKESRMNLGQYSFVLYDLRTAHVRFYPDMLSDEIIERIMNRIYDHRLLSQIHIPIILTCRELKL